MKIDIAQLLFKALEETGIMVSWALLLAVVIGGLIGLFLFLTSNCLFVKNTIVNEVVGIVINVIRSIPFLILLILLLPLSKIVVGTKIGPTAVILPLAIASIAFYARLAEASFHEVDRGVLEAAISSGAGTFAIIKGILLPEALPQLLKNVTVTAISLVGFSAMAGTVGGGGIGDLAIRYGYQRYQTNVMIICVIALVVIVQVLQFIGDMLAKAVDRK